MTYSDITLWSGSAGKRDCEGGVYSSDFKLFIGLEVKNTTSYRVAHDAEVISSMAFSKCLLLQNLVLPESIKEVGKLAFLGCHSLESITLPSSVKKIRSNPFGTRLRVKVEGANFQTDGYTLLSADGTCLLAFTDTEAVSYKVPDGVTRIASSAFYGCSSLRKVEFAPSVREVSNDVFCDCDALEEVTIGKNVRFKTFKYKAWDFLQEEANLWAGGNIQMLPGQKNVGVVCGHKIKVTKLVNK